METFVTQQGVANLVRQNIRGFPCKKVKKRQNDVQNSKSVNRDKIKIIAVSARRAIARSKMDQGRYSPTNNNSVFHNILSADISYAY